MREIFHSIEKETAFLLREPLYLGEVISCLINPLLIE